ncbi:DUF4145 domain-containing protein [Defluviimonas sp. SAOS-178_SWC]|uniref:DUF4145 domain-containing protein n=1 Tax=Defluviimonas sp. SAOS-178_SWC TaxID=3121287 RepID=UPI0032219B92
MGQLRFDCPHAGCRTNSSAFTTLNESPIGNQRWHVFAVCASCRHTIIVEATGNHPSEKPSQFGHAEFAKRFSVTAIWPEPPKLSVVEHLDEEIRATYDEAEACYADGHSRAAAMAYRATIELALKNLNPEGKGMLAARIRAMKGTLPDGLIDLLNHVKFLGNEAAHAGAPDIDDLKAGRDFTRLFLTYTFELPARVQAAVDRRVASEASSG